MMQPIRKLEDTRLGRDYIRQVIDEVYAPNLMYVRLTTPWELPDRPWMLYYFTPYPRLAKVEWWAKRARWKVRNIRWWFRDMRAWLQARGYR